MKINEIKVGDLVEFMDNLVPRKGYVYFIDDDKVYASESQYSTGGHVWTIYKQDVLAKIENVEKRTPIEPPSKMVFDFFASSMHISRGSCGDSATMNGYSEWKDGDVLLRSNDLCLPFSCKLGTSPKYRVTIEKID